MSEESQISIFVKQMRVNVRIGLQAYEKGKPQPLLVSVELFTAPSYLAAVDESKIIDYALIHEAVKSWETRPHVDLIETYLKELLDLAFGFEDINACRASISKPAIFEEAEGAGLTVFMRKADWVKA